MKKYFVILILVLTSITLYSQESGWFNNGDHLEQKFVLDSLTKLHCTKDGKQFYTFHKPNTINIWDMQSGKIQSSFLIDDFQLNSLNISRDDKYLMLSYNQLHNKEYVYGYYKIIVIDLSSKERVAFIKDIFPISYFHPPSETPGCLYINCQMYLIDINLKENYFLINYKLEFSGNPNGTIMHYDMGDIGKIFFKDSTYDKSINYNKNRTESELFFDDLNITYNCYNFISQSITYSVVSFRTFNLLTDLKNMKSIKEFSYSGKQLSSYTKFTDLFRIKNNRFITRYDSIFYYVDIQKQEITDSLIIKNQNFLYKTTSLGNYLVAYNPTSTKIPKYFYYYNLDTKKLTDSIPCNFNATNYDIVPKTDKIIAWDNTGKIQLLNGDVISYIKGINLELEINIKTKLPNIIININQEFATDSDLMIYDILGNLVYKRQINENQKEVILNTEDLNLLNGFYIVTIKNQGVLKSVPLVIY